MRRTVGVLAVLGAVLLAGCSGSPDESSASPSRSGASASASSADATASSSPSSPEDTNATDQPASPGADPGMTAGGVPAPAPPITIPSAEVGLGATATYSDAVQVTVTRPATFQPTPSAMTGGDFPAFIRMTVTVQNGSQQTLRLDEVYVGVESEGTEGTRVVDDAAGLSDPASTAEVAPGQTGQFDIAFGVNNAADLTIEASPSFGAPVVIWANR